MTTDIVNFDALQKYSLSRPDHLRYQRRKSSVEAVNKVLVRAFRKTSLVRVPPPNKVTSAENGKAKPAPTPAGKPEKPEFPPVTRAAPALPTNVDAIAQKLAKMQLQLERQEERIQRQAEEIKEFRSQRGQTAVAQVKGPRVGADGWLGEGQE